MKRLATVVASAAAAALLAGGVPALAADGPSGDAVENASTAADHNAIADSYEEQAKNARARAQAHHSMGTSYGKGPAYRLHPGRKNAMTNHCKRLTDSYNQTADTYDQMAKAHREAAAEAGK